MSHLARWTDGWSDGQPSSCRTICRSAGTPWWPRAARLPRAAPSWSPRTSCSRSGVTTTAQLYSVRSEQSWGIGDLADLRDVARRARRRTGADFLLINPLHAAEPVTPLTPSPYLPRTRRFVNPIYLRVEESPETAYLPVAERSLVEWQAEAARPLSADPGPIGRDAVWDAKKVALEVVFAAPRSRVRQARFDAFRAEQGEGLEDFATWCALTEHFGGQEWPLEVQDRHSDAVQQLRTELADRITLHCWLQWVADEQLAAAQADALQAGMRLGIMHDLAVGVHPGGADGQVVHDPQPHPGLQCV